MTFSSLQILGSVALQNTLLPRFTAATTRNTMSSVPQFLGADSLLASSYAWQWSSLILPDDQWINELSNWFSTSLISLQLFSASYVQSDTPQWNSFSKIPPSAEEKWMCSNQIVNRDEYTSFSVLGLSIIIGVGCIIILVSFFLQRLVKLFEPNTPENRVRAQTWTELGLFQLQRKVLGKPDAWDGEGDVPTASSTERFEMDLRLPASPSREDEREEPLIRKTPQQAIDEVSMAGPGSINDQIHGPDRTPMVYQDKRRWYESMFGRR